MILLSGLVVLLFISAASAQDAKLIDAAKKESGKVVAYGSLENTAIDPIIDAFEKKTAIKVEYFRFSATKAMERGLTELRAGKAFIYFFLNADGIMKLLAKAGEFVTMKGIPQLLPGADKIQPVERDDLDNKGYADKREEYRKAFLK